MMKDKFNLTRFRTRYFIRASAIGLAVFFFITIGFYWFSGWQTDQLIIERLENQELSMARSAALSINQSLRARKKELVLLSELEPIQANKEKEGMKILEILAQELKEEGAQVGNIIRVDKEGMTLWGINVELERQDENAIGVNVGDQDCFLWAKEKGEKGKIFINEPIVVQGGYLKGKRVVSMITPVYYQGKFDGIVSITFPIDELAKKYIEPISLSPQTYFTILSEEGVVITSTFEELIGKNILQIQAEENWPKASQLLVERALQGEEGTSYHSYINLLTGKPSEAVSAYSPIRINGSFWSLWVSIPYERVKELVLPFKQNQTFALVIVLSGSLALAIIYVLGIRVVHKNGFLDGYVRAEEESGGKKKKK